MRVLGIDPGYHTGWGVISEAGKLASELLNLDHCRSDQDYGRIALLAYETVTAVAMRYHVTHIAREQLFIAKRGSNPASVLPRAAVCAGADMAGRKMCIPVRVVTVKDWRMATIGVHRAPKPLPKACKNSSDWFKAQAWNYCGRGS